MAPRRIDPKSIAADTVLAALLAPRASGPRAPITLEHDGNPVRALEGEPLAIALLANGIDTLARSVKFHRPRGPSCLRGGCEGCLVRVDGVPNVMACRVPCRDGTRVHSQNAFPSASMDLLRVTDWFFPKRFDHHHLMVKYGEGINRAMQVFARRMAGLGTLPDADGPIPEPEAIDCDVLVVGGGPAGLAAAADLAASGLHVVLVEEERETGGMLRDELERLPSAHGTGPTGAAFADALTARARAAGVDVRTDASATATFDNATVVSTPERALFVRARARLFANGCHEQIGAFESNDLPGVYTARAAARALVHGVIVGERVVIVGNARPARGLARALADAGAHVEWITDGTLEAAGGVSAVSHARLTAAAGRADKYRCDAIAIASAPTPAFELLGQAGVPVEPDAAHGCFVPHADANGCTARADVFAAGSVRGANAGLGPVVLARPLEAGGPVADGLRVAASVRAFLRGERAAHKETRP